MKKDNITVVIGINQTGHVTVSMYDEELRSWIEPQDVYKETLALFKNSGLTVTNSFVFKCGHKN